LWVFEERKELAIQQDQEKSLLECESNALTDHVQGLKVANEAMASGLENFQRGIDELQLAIAKNESQLVTDRRQLIY
jgi:hypothetical protein